MSQNLIISILGLNTNANQLSGVLPGSLSIAKNVSIDRDKIAESRRGFAYLAGAPDAPCEFDRLNEFQDKLIGRRYDDDTLNWYNGSAWTSYNSGATFEHPDADYARMRFLRTSSNLYFTTSSGVKVLDQYNGTVYSTGMPKGLDGSAATTGTSGFMTNNTQVAYRIVWGSKDANNNLFLGAPSQRLIVANTSGGTRDVTVSFTIPSGITVNDFYQIYRSKESASSTDEPNDELQLVYEANPTSGQISAKSVSVTDSTATSLLGAYLYTNSSQEGLSQENSEPPFAKDIALFKGYLFYGNTKIKHRLYISLLSVGAPNGLQLNDTITINSMIFTAKSAENIASREFKLFTTGSVSQNIADTALSIVKVVNQYTSNTSIYAYYVSEYTELPGQILLEKRTINSSSFSVTASRSTAWDLDDGVSDDETFINGLSWSKIQQPEHVPAANLERIGSNNYEIRRILALRDSLFILKDDGVFRLTGTGGVWSIDPLDTSTRLIAPDSAVVLNNQIFALTDQGIVSISDVGVEIKGIPIDDQIKDLISQDYEKLKTLTYGISYETERKYILNTIENASDLVPTKQFVYNTITQKWTTWDRSSRHGYVANSDGKLYLAKGESNQVYVERKALNGTDFTDEEITGFNVVSYSGYDVVLDTISGIEIGDLLFEDETKNSIISAIDSATKTVTVEAGFSWAIGAVSIFKGIESELEFTNLTNDNPGLMKHYQEIAWLFREKEFVNAYSGCYTDLSGGYQETEIAGDYGGGSWGLFAWGGVPWGGVQRPKPIRVFIPREKSRGSLLSIRFRIRNARSKWSLNGISMEFEYVSERMTRS